MIFSVTFLPLSRNLKPLPLIHALVPMAQFFFSLCSWFCHVDDDMYVVYKSLIEALSHFDPTKEKVYFGRSGSLWEEPRKVKNDSLIGTPGEPYHFAVGGIYCLSRTLVEAAMPHLV